ncbi:GatB/YqeY domain-containing protein [Candidatus Gottesmanbacteria bacterium]|nr:GatB/YqeY domain-containing protein [Candidatus Gottesmanbacteria bacterium]
MIKNEIQQAINNALKAGKKMELKALRFVISQIKYGEIDKQKELIDEEVVSLMQKEIKKRKEAIEMFKKGNRNDLVTDEEAQIMVIQRFLPQQLTSEELEKIVADTISETADKNMGKIIGSVMAKVKGKADGSAVSSLVRQKLRL